MMAAALGAALLFGAAPRAHAGDDHAKCQHRVEKAEGRLDQAVRRYGQSSPQAQSRRHQLDEERERCWSAYHGWWNGAERKWHNDRDWDRDHQDRDHDRDEHHDDHR